MLFTRSGTKKYYHVKRILVRKVSTARIHTKAKDVVISQDGPEEFITHLGAGQERALMQVFWQVQLNTARGSEGAWCRAVFEKCF